MSQDQPQPTAPAASGEEQVGSDAPEEVEIEELVDFTLDFLEDLIEHLDIDAEVFAEAREGRVMVEIEGEDVALLIGRHGATLEALETLARAAVSTRSGHFAPISIDIEGYQARRQEELAEQARQLAERVAESKEPAHLAPMSAAERRAVHEALVDHPHVRTESDGEGRDRHVVIHPK